MAAVLALAASLLPLAAHAERPLEGRSIIVLCYESIDGAATNACAVEADLRRALVSEGALLVDAAQAARLRQQYAPERFQAGADLSGIDLLDAEIGVVVRARASTLHTVGRVSSFDTELSIDAIDVSRAAVLTMTSEKASFRALGGAQALSFLSQRFAKAGAARFVGDLVEAISRPVALELWVYDLKEGLSQVQAIEAAIKESRLAPQVRRVNFDGDLAKWRLTLGKGQSPDALALHLEKAGLLLSVQGVTGGMMQLAYRPQAHLKLPVQVEASLDEKLPRWFRDGAEDLVRNTLLGEGWLLPVDAGAAHMAKVVVEAAPSGRGSYALSLKLLHEDGRSIAAAREKGRESELAARLDEGVQGLLQNFRRYLEKNPGQLAELKRVFDAGQALEVQVALGEDGIVRGGSAERGSLAVRPKLDEGRVRTRVAGVSEFGAWRPLEAGVAALSEEDAAALLGLTSTGAHRLEVEVEGRVGPRMYRETAAHAFVFHPASTFDRERLETLARLVDPSPAWAPALLGAALDGAKPEPTAELARAARAWDRVMGLGLSVDEAAGEERFVALRPSAEVLASRQGSREALAALVATTFEAAGLETALLRTPGALLVAVDSGLPASAWPLLASREPGVLDVGGRAFLPVDPAAVTGDFWRAAFRGTEALARHAKRVERVSPRARWQEEPPVKLRAVALDAAREREPTKLLVLDLKAAGFEEDAPRLLQDSLTRAFSSIPALGVVSSEDVRRMLDAEAMKQLVGCDESSCLSEIADAMGARVIVFGSLLRAGDKTRLSLSLSDTKKAVIVGRVELEGPDAAALAARTPAAASRLAAAFFEAEGIPSSGPWAFDAHVARLAEQLPKDPYARARFYALASDLDAADQEVRRVKDKRRRALAEAHVALLRGQPDQALARYQTLGSEEAATAGLLAATRAGDTEKAKVFAARAKKAAPAPDTETIPIRFLIQW